MEQDEKEKLAMSLIPAISGTAGHRIKQSDLFLQTCSEQQLMILAIMTGAERKKERDTGRVL